MRWSDIYMHQHGVRGPSVGRLETEKILRNLPRRT